MLSKVAKLMLTSTALAPVLLTYAWMAARSGAGEFAAILAAGCAALVLICIAVLAYAEKELEKIPFKVASVEAADREHMTFLLLYLLPLFTSDFDSLNWDVWVPAILVFAIVTATGYSYHFNPLLGICFGYHFYKVGTEECVTYILITKKELRNVTTVLYVAQLTEYIVIEVGGE